MKQKSIEIDGARIGYWESDGKGPAVVCCHGNSSSGRAFLDLGSRLTAARVFALDFYGHGATPLSAPTRCSLAGYVALIDAFVRRLEIGPFVLVGHSLGGHASVEALPDLGAALRGVIVLSAPPFNRETVSASFRDPTEGAIFKSELAPHEIARLAGAFARPENLGEGVAARIEADIRQTDGRARTLIGKALAEGAFADEVALYRGSTVPLSFVQGTDDPFINVDCYRRLPLVEGRDRVVLLDGVRHSPQLEAGARVAEIVTAHLPACQPMRTPSEPGASTP